MSDPEPRISVVVPVFQGERFIADCIRSVLEQTEQDWELIVIDNGSTDHTADVVAWFPDPRIRFLVNAPNTGAVHNWNRGMAEVRGRYLKLLCADDLLYPTCLEKQAAVLDDPANEGVSLVTAQHVVIDPSGRRIIERGFKRGGRVSGRKAILRMARSGTNLVGEPGGVMFRAQAFAAVGPFSEQARYVVDLDMWMRLLLQGDAYVIDESLSAFRVQGESWSNALTSLQTTDYADMLRRHADDGRFGISRMDVRLGTLGAWRNAQSRRIFYRMFLHDVVAPDD
jgi:glycosyltransferase involved in cell wall biosynthesis